jgi:peptidylprolyl isomerase
MQFPHHWSPSLLLLLVAPAALAADLSAPSDLETPPADAVRSAGGLVTRVLRKGTGRRHPVAGDTLDVHYTGWSADGKMFSSSLSTGGPARVVLAGMPEGWRRGIPQMTEGEKRRFWIPAALAFGDKTVREDMPGGPLVYDVELVRIIPPAPTNEAPPDVKAPPRSAHRTPSGLAYKLVKKGWGHEHPNKNEVVVVHYNAWTPDGKLFDSTRARGQQMTIPLSGAMPGWAEGLKLMVAGEIRRFWIPAALAHGDPPRKRRFPAGMTVFEIELLQILEPGEVETD